MYELLGCPHCHRHARASEAACPFCGGSLEGAVPGEVRGVSRRELTRGAIVMGAAALVGGCGSSSEEREDDTAGGGEGTSGGDDGGGHGDEQLEHRHRECEADDMSCMAMPYGAPALPESIV